MPFYLNICLYIFLFASNSFAQSPALMHDCEKATEILASGNYVFKEAPIGAGEQVEFNGSAKSLYSFRREENSAWFKLKMAHNGMLTFTIYPRDTAADFDFLLFESTDKFCSDIRRRKIKPIRSNMSRYKPSDNCKTGLQLSSEMLCIPSGPGNNYSAALEVKKGDFYYLVINNEYATQTQFKLSFEYYVDVELSGIVSDQESGIGIGDALISWENDEGEVLAETKSEKETGSFRFNAPVKWNLEPVNYTLAISDEVHMIEERRVKITPNYTPEPISIVLPNLKKGSRMTLNSINFQGNSAETLPSSTSSLKRLYKLMKANEELTIMIEGHTNGCGNGRAFSQTLSENRAKAVKEYLMEKGIAIERIKTIGYNCSRMLYPAMRNAEEQMLNRRVEILVQSYKNDL